MADAEFSFDGVDPSDLANALEGFDDALMPKLEDAANEIGLRVVAEASRLVNVDTGRLKASLSHGVQKIGAYAIKVSAGSNVSYAGHHEADFPFLRPAIESVKEKIDEILANAVNEAAAEVGFA